MSKFQSHSKCDITSYLRMHCVVAVRLAAGMWIKRIPNIKWWLALHISYTIIFISSLKVCACASIMIPEAWIVFTKWCERERSQLNAFHKNQIKGDHRLPAIKTIQFLWASKRMLWTYDTIHGYLLYPSNCCWQFLCILARCNNFYYQCYLRTVRVSFCSFSFYDNHDHSQLILIICNSLASHK